MKVLKKIRNIFAVVFLAIFLLFIVAISTLLLSRNDYGITQFNDKALIIIDDKISNNNYNAGELVIVKEKTIDQLQIGDEVFVYSSNQKTKKVEIIVSKISVINKEDKYNPSVTLENDKGTWGIEFIAGTTYKKYEKVGRLLSIIQSKWIFFILLIVPCFFVLLYEIYLLVVLIKYDDGLDEDEEVKENKNEKIEEKVEAKEETPEVKEESKEEKTEPKEESEAKEEAKEEPKEEPKEESKEEPKEETKEEPKEESKEEVKEEKQEKENNKTKEEPKDNKSEDKKEDKKENTKEKEEDKNESINYDELAKKIATSDANNEEIEKQLLELKEKMIKEKEEKEKKAKQEKIDSLLKEISELKDELDK